MATFKVLEGKQYKYRDSGRVTVATILGEKAFVAFPKTDGKVRYVWAGLSDLSPLRGRPSK
jgi:hypothetical protein